MDILIEASNGASDYGNCFGEPLIYGFTRTFGLRLPDGYRSWYKPIMYSVGAGQIRDEHTVKGKPEKDMLVVQVGGPAYRIGMGGGAASSMEQGDERPGARLQRRPARRSRDGAAGQPPHAGLRGAGRGESDRLRP